jgi:hypothetical protein
LRHGIAQRCNLRDDIVALVSVVFRTGPSDKLTDEGITHGLQPRLGIDHL